MKGKRRSSVHTNYLKSVETIQTNLEVYICFQVNFVGEGSVDTGGPRREFFRLLAGETQKSTYFHSSSDSAGTFFSLNTSGFQVCS